MSDAQKIIRDVLRRRPSGTCDCGTCVAVWAETVAAEIDEALGELMREEAFRYTHNASGRSTILDVTDVPMARKIAGTTHALAEVSRWVSGYAEVADDASADPADSVEARDN